MVSDNWPDPTPEMLESPLFNVLWQAIKTWDICVPEVDGHGLYSGATGNHVRHILDAVHEHDAGRMRIFDEIPLDRGERHRPIDPSPPSPPSWIVDPPDPPDFSSLRMPKRLLLPSIPIVHNHMLRGRESSVAYFCKECGEAIPYENPDEEMVNCPECFWNGFWSDCDVVGAPAGLMFVWDEKPSLAAAFAAVEGHDINPGMAWNNGQVVYDPDGPTYGRCVDCARKAMECVCSGHIDLVPSGVMMTANER